MPSSREVLFMGGNNGTTYKIAGTTFLYHILQENEDTLREQLTARGPLVQPLRVEVRERERERGGVGGDFFFTLAKQVT